MHHLKGHASFATSVATGRGTVPGWKVPRTRTYPHNGLELMGPTLLSAPTKGITIEGVEPRVALDMTGTTVKFYFRYGGCLLSHQGLFLPKPVRSLG